MSYRIEYGPMPKSVERASGSPMRLQLLTAVCLILFAVLVRQIWPEGTAMLRSCLIPGEATVAEAAFSDMMTDIRSGEPLEEAFTVFCRQIIDEADISD